MTSTKYPSFVIVCPNCSVKQTGFLKISALSEKEIWSCAKKGCNCLLFDFEIKAMLGITVGETKPQTP